VGDLKITVDQIEKEREFYFGKLREIEIFIQGKTDQGVEPSFEVLFKQIQEIMYKV
jgi:RP/EB family microtubule-associated protein